MRVYRYHPDEFCQTGLAPPPPPPPTCNCRSNLIYYPIALCRLLYFLRQRTHMRPRVTSNRRHPLHRLAHGGGITRSPWQPYRQHREKFSAKRQTVCCPKRLEGEKFEDECSSWNSRWISECHVWTWTRWHWTLFDPEIYRSFRMRLALKVKP